MTAPFHPVKDHVWGLFREGMAPPPGGMKVSAIGSPFVVKPIYGEIDGGVLRPEVLQRDPGSREKRHGKVTVEAAARVHRHREGSHLTGLSPSV